jgi:ABC-type nitrate/sulfonate/bicarbonate transport system substrate-binding protein
MHQSTARPGRRRGLRDAIARVGLCALTLLCTAGCVASPSRPAVEQQGVSPAGEPRAPTRLDVAYTSVGLTQAYLWIAQEAGYFGEEELAVQLHYVPGTTVAVQSLVGRELQFLAGAGAASISAALGGADTVILATTTDQFTNILMGQPDLLPTADSIRGQPVAVTRFGASSDFVARYWLRRLGLEPGADAPIIQVGGNPEMAAALVSGAARIASVADLFALDLQRQGYRELGGINEPGLDTVNTGLIASRGYVAASGESVQRFLRAAFRGLGRFVQDEALSVAVVARYSQVTMPDVLAAAWEAHAKKYTKRIPYTTASAVQMTLEELALADARAQTASPDAFYDNHFVRELDQAQFFTALYAP